MASSRGVTVRKGFFVGDRNGVDMVVGDGIIGDFWFLLERFW